MTDSIDAIPREDTDAALKLRQRIEELELHCAALKSNEQHLLRSEEVYRSIVQSMLGGLVRVAMDGSIVDANAQAQRILNLSFDELASRFISDFEQLTIREDGTPCPVQEYPVYKCIATGEPQPPATIGLVQPSGSVLWAMFTAAPLFDPHTRNQAGAVVTFLDVTEHLRAAAALRESEERFRLAARAVRGLIYDWNVVENTVHRSEGLRELLGFDASESPQTVEWWTQRIHPDDVAATIARMKAAAEDVNLDTIDIEYRVRHRDGRYVHVWDRSVFVRNRSGKVIRQVGNTIDISDRKAAETTLRQQAAILDQIHDAVIETSMDGCITRWNAGAQRLYGYRADEVLGKHVSILVPPGSEQFLQEKVLGQLIRQGDHDLEMTVRRKDGELRFVHLSLSLFRDEAGNNLGTIGFSVDITDRQQAQNALRTHNARLRAILDYTPAIIYIKDRQGCYIEFNRTAQLLFNVSRDALIGKTAFDLLPTDVANDVSRDDKDVLRSGKIVTRERRFTTPQGERVFLDMKFPLLDDQSIPYAVCGIATDITERMRTEEVMRENTTLQRLMLSELDHRVRNNLASLAALIDLTSRDKTTVAELATAIRGRVHAMSSVHSLLSRTRWSDVHLNSLVEALVPDDLRARVHIDGDNLCVSPRQASAMGMILQELVANSLKYGSLREVAGIVRLAWTCDADATQAERNLQMTWEECNGPEILQQPKLGLGSDLLVGFARTELRGDVELNFPRQGVRHVFKLKLDPIQTPNVGQAKKP